MDTKEVDRLVRFNEPETGPARRVLFEFTNGSYMVVLLNDGHPEIRDRFMEICPGLADHSFEQNGSVYELALEQQIVFKPEEKIPPLSAWTIATDGRRVVVPTRDLSGNKVDGESEFVPFGIIITGKTNIRHRIRSVRLMGKLEPTQFVSDEFGDSYNDSYFKEPRIIDSVPSTVFHVIDDLFAIAKAQYAAQNYTVAAKKYQKAFHYIHSYYPEHLDPADLEKLTAYKTRALLNLSLASNKNNDPKKAIEAAKFVLDMPEARNQPTNLAKAYYQLGTATLSLGDEVQAEKYYELSDAAKSDPATKNSILACKKIQAERRAREKSLFQTAFSTKR